MTEPTFFHTDVSTEAIELVVEVLRSGRLSEGPMVQRFEQGLSAQLGLRNPVAMNSGTSALHLALSITGVGPGDEVILPPQTFVATGLCVLMCGATPVFADVRPDTGNLDPESFRRAITPRTKAVMPVHWGGYPCDLDEIGSIASAHGIAVIEDAAHALGATYKGRPIGAISRFTAFSFQAIKHLTTGDGGALCCHQLPDHEQARVRRWFGIDRWNTTVSFRGERSYDIAGIGYKYHMNDLAAAVGCGNLMSFTNRLGRRRRVASRYSEGLAGVPGVMPCAWSSDRTHAFWIYTMRAERRDDLIRKLTAEGLPVSVVHMRIDRNRVFGGRRKDLPGQDAFDDLQVSLPVHEALADEDVERILRVIKAGW